MSSTRQVDDTGQLLWGDRMPSRTLSDKLKRVYAEIDEWLAVRNIYLQYVVDWQKGDAGQPGHPIVFGPLLRQVVMQAQGGRGVREWRRAHPAQVQALALEHARCTTDVDTPEDLRRLGERWGVWIRPPRPADPAAP